MSDLDLLDPPTRPVSRKAANRQAKRQENADKVPGAKPLEAKTENQRKLITHHKAGRDVFAVGPAGTGKTYIPARMAAQALKFGQTAKIIITRVAVSKPKHNLGFLPGAIDKKMAPWLVPVFDGIRAEVSGTTLETWMREGKVEIVPFEFMRGRTFHDAWIILDEAQNADFSDLQLFLTRTGDDSQVIITGDLEQIDVHNSGLADVIDVALDYDVPIEVIHFSENDVVRSAKARAWVKGFAAAKRRRDRDDDVTEIDSLPGFLQSRGSYPHRANAS